MKRIAVLTSGGDGPGLNPCIRAVVRTALDKELEELPSEMITAIEALKEPFALNRGIHRKMHLDEIDALLKARRGNE